MVRFFLEAFDQVIGVDFRNAEVARFGGVDLDGRDGGIGRLRSVPGQHIPVVHLVYVVGGEDQHMSGDSVRMLCRF